MSEKNKILVIDDEEDIRRLISFRIKRFTDYDVINAGDGEEGFKTFMSNQDSIDLVITDIKMPKKNGIELLRSIKAVDPSMGVIIISGHGNMEDTIEALRSGAINFFRKPIDMKEMLNVIQKYFKIKKSEILVYDVCKYLITEYKEFSLPNDLNLITAVIEQLTNNLVGNRIVKKQMLNNIKFALREMIINAIEHGNLGITYKEKSQYLDNMGNMLNLIDERAKLEENKNKKILITYQLNEEKVIYQINDEGKGFNMDDIPDPTDPNNILKSHGRGIMMSRLYFDDFFYNDIGNQLTMIKKREKDN